MVVGRVSWWKYVRSNFVIDRAFAMLTSAAKSRFYLVLYTARLKPCPFKTVLYGTAEAVPFQNSFGAQKKMCS
jgi:hypothetical protein